MHGSRESHILQKILNRVSETISRQMHLHTFSLRAQLHTHVLKEYYGINFSMRLGKILLHISLLLFRIFRSHNKIFFAIMFLIYQNLIYIQIHKTGGENQVSGIYSVAFSTTYSKSRVCKLAFHNAAVSTQLTMVERNTVPSLK